MSTIEEAHRAMVSALVKSGNTIADEVDGSDMHLIHMMMGVAGETGELLDAIKKHVIYRKPLDRANVIEELGDIEFYLEGLRQGLDISRDVVLYSNREKLSERYPNYEYSDDAAKNRADKA